MARRCGSLKYQLSPILTFAIDSSEIKNSVEIIVAEDLMTLGLTVLDRNGDVWRPRLRKGGSIGVRKRKSTRSCRVQS